MNYIKEINTFYDWLEINELSASAVNLWYAFMHINNKAGWVETFTVAESVLSVKTRLSGRTIRDARNELKQKGRIDFKSRSGGRAPIYTIISFESGINIFKRCSAEAKEETSAQPTEINSVEDNTTENITGDSAGVTSEDSAGDSAGVRATLYKLKLNETKLNNTSTTITISPDLLDCYISCGFEKTKNSTDALKDYIEKYSKEWVMEAIKECDQQGTRTNKYLGGILKNWEKAGQITLTKEKASDKGKDNYFNGYSGQRKYDIEELEEEFINRDEDVSELKRKVIELSKQGLSVEDISKDLGLHLKLVEIFLNSE